MYFGNIDYTVFYIDPSKATNGDGSSVQDAANQLPADDAGYSENTCYLIRRTAETAAVTLSNISCGRKNLLFMGMPKETDWPYQYVPQMAKDAWSADAAEYANMKSTVSNGRFTLPNIQNLNLYRIYLYRQNLIPQDYIFYITSETYTAQVSFQQCKFGALGVNLDDAGYTSAVTDSRAGYYFYALYIKSFIMNDCLVNFALPTSNAYGFYCEFSQFISIQNVTANNVFQSASGANYVFYFRRNYNERPLTAYFENLTMNIKLNGAYQYVPYLLYVSGPEVLTVRNINIGITGNLGTASPTNLCLYGHMIIFSTAREYDIDGVNVGLPGVWNVESNGSCLFCEGFYAGSRTPGNMKTVKNIYISMEEEAGIDTAGGKYYDRVKHTSFDRYAAFRFTGGGYDDNRICTPAILENINVRNVRGVAAYFYSCQIRNARFSGAVKMSYMIADIESIESWYPAYAIFCNLYSTIRVQRVHLNLENEAYPPAEEPVIYNNQTDNYFCFVDWCNARLRPNVMQNSTANNDPAAICANEVETGHFSQKTVNYIIDTWTVSRVNGAPASLKLSNNGYNSTYECWLGKEPFGGSKINPVEAGLHYLVVYAAYKGFSNPEDLGAKCVIQANVPQADGTFRRYFSNVHGAWLPDELSTWQGDSGLTLVMLVMAVDLPTLNQVDLKIKFSWYSAAGFMYIDPAFALYPASEVPVNEPGVGEEG